MRKSERLRVAEMEILRLSFELDYLKAIVSALIEANGAKLPDLDAGKWYSRKTGNPDIPNN